MVLRRHHVWHQRYSNQLRIVRLLSLLHEEKNFADRKTIVIIKVIPINNVDDDKALADYFP